jgi:hypothetical protein
MYNPETMTTLGTLDTVKQISEKIERTIKYVQSRDNDYIGHTRHGITNIRENGKDNQACTIQRQ